jgi:SNF2 family DNA or RNA helicase
VVDAIKIFQPDLVIVDESHRLKSASSNVSRAAARIGRLCPRRLILTGTVMPHSPMDVWAQWRFLEPEAFYSPDSRLPGGRKPMSFGAFQDRYGVFGGWQGRQVIAYKNLGEMQKVMEANSIVVRKADALDLPPVMDITVPVHLSPAEQRAYDDMKGQLATVMSDGTFASVPNRLAQMMRLRQITSGYLPDDNGVTRIIGSSKVDAATSTVMDTLAGQRRVVVFAHFRQEVAALADRLRYYEPKSEVMTITGDTPPKEREALRKRFGSDEKQRIILVAQMRTLSLAVNELVSASHAVFTSLSERRDDVVQARDRLNRLGQKGPSVTFWNVEVPGSVDEVIRKAHLTRESIETALLAYIRGDQAGK